MLDPVYKQINLLLGWQSLIGTLCVCFFFLLGREEGLSALLAVVAVTIPNVCFGLMLRGERDPAKDVIRGFIRIAFLLVNLGIAFAFFDIRLECSSTYLLCLFGLFLSYLRLIV